MKLRLCCAVLASILVPNILQADAVYTFTGDYSSSSLLGVPNSVVQWQFVVPTLLTATTHITSFVSTSVTGGLSNCTISDVEISNPSATSSDQTSFFASPCGPQNFFTGAAAHFQQPITSFGTYSLFTTGGASIPGTLTITSQNAVPEPGSLLLLGSGLIGGIGAMRRRFPK